MLSVATRSRPDCARRCSSLEACVLFTFTNGAPTGTCRLHSQVMTSQCPTSQVPGSKVYKMKGAPDYFNPMDNEGWTVFQRRQDGSVDFNRTWDDYVNGFGDPSGECWLGLETLHNLTSEGNWTLRIDLGDWEGNMAYATYTGFYITSSSKNYRLKFDSESYSGNAGDALAYHRNKMFSTHDVVHTSCPSCLSRGGGWWFHCCGDSKLNGEYVTASPAGSVVWRYWKGGFYSLKFSEMKIKRE